MNYCVMLVPELQLTVGICLPRYCATDRNYAKSTVRLLEMDGILNQNEVRVDESALKWDTCVASEHKAPFELRPWSQIQFALIAITVICPLLVTAINPVSLAIRIRKKFSAGSRFAS